MSNMFKPVDAVPNFPQIEYTVLEAWKKHKVFEKSIESRPATKRWNFLDGPPFVTGMPHYGSLLSSLPKDVFGRYWTMKGYQVRRVWGWDGHGLPIENKVENELGVKRKKDIEQKVGVGTFIQHCKKYVDQISAEWEWYVDHIGRWVDFTHAYRTWDTDYMESVMWVFKQMYDKGYVYKGLRVSLYCPHCSTPISNFEVAMDADNYRDVTEAATTYKYKVAGEKNHHQFGASKELKYLAQILEIEYPDLDLYFLAWSTTPWNKIVTPALAVNPKLTYAVVKQNEQLYILGHETLKMLGEPDTYKIVEQVHGRDLIGTKFEPHYDYYEIEEGKKAFEIVGGDFVTEDEGTGIVTLAVYGEEDMAVMKRDNIQMVFHVDDEGMVKQEVPKFGGMYYLKANKAVNEDLAQRGLVYRNDDYTHSVAHCWRCATRLFYNPQTAWFVNVQDLKDRMKQTNEQVNWFPTHFKHGRFEKSMESAPDWNISRNRYWGSPVPVWECECGERFVPGSIAQLEQASGQKVPDLHKPHIDEVSVPCLKCTKTMKRTPEVLDSWIEAGSASFAERHFPFDQSAKLEDFFPPDFIAEYTGQIRAWFYVLHVIAAAIYERPAFKNVLVTGVIMGSDGRKMSKNFKNYPDPRQMLEKYGGDALRLYLLGSPVVKGEDILISETEYRQQVRGLMLVLWNVYKFYVTYANMNDFTPDPASSTPVHVLDRWIMARLHQLIVELTREMEAYDTVDSISLIHDFVQDLSTWYLRRSRDRKQAYETLHTVLTTIPVLLAPLAPFISEAIFTNLTGQESVHLTDWPTAQEQMMDQELLDNMKLVRQIAEAGNAARKKVQIALKQPLASMTVSLPGAALSDQMSALLQDELNVKQVIYTQAEELAVTFDTVLTPQLEAEGQMRTIVRQIQQARKAAAVAIDQTVAVELPAWPDDWEDEIKRRAKVSTLTKGQELKVIV
jgi:isoleucyl-tRNA synthetase